MNKYKDCVDWTPMKDGTITGDSKYCDLSLHCRQIGMKSDKLYITKNDGFIEIEYFCTGMYVTKDNKLEDNEVS